MKPTHCEIWWRDLGEERQAALLCAMPPDALARDVTEKPGAAWWGGLGEERQAALPPRT